MKFSQVHFFRTVVITFYFVVVTLTGICRDCNQKQDSQGQVCEDLQMWPGQNVFFENSVEYSKCKACCQNYQERDNGDYQAKKLHPISTYAYYEQVINKYQSKQGCEIKIRDRWPGIRLGSLVNQNTAIVNNQRTKADPGTSIPYFNFAPLLGLILINH